MKREKILINCFIKEVMEKENKDKYYISIPKEEFSEWYTEVIKKADIVDTRYPVKGMNIWKPYGLKALKLMLSIMEELLEKTGHEEVYFPLLIPERIFEKERDFLEGFQGEAYIVTHAGDKKLNEKLYVRPTSETVMYEMFKLWIQSKSDLPLKVFQTVNVFRYETKQTRPLLRVREIIKFKEAHTAHKSREDAKKQVEEAIEVYSKFFKKLKLPYLLLKTPEWDTFPGAEYNYDFISMMPDGKAIELGSVINLGDKFARAFDIKYFDGEKYSYVYQTCYGISERTLGALISIHGDDRGIVFPSSIAPIQVVIIPVRNDEELINKANEVKESLGGLRVKIDDRDKRIGEKFYYWEMKGVPVKIEIGKREIKEGVVVIGRRDKKEKIKVDESKVKEKVMGILEDYDKSLEKRGEENLIKRIERLEEVKRFEEEERGLKEAMWCGEKECALSLEEKINIPVIGYKEKKVKGRCLHCGNQGETYLLYFGRTY